MRPDPLGDVGGLGRLNGISQPDGRAAIISAVRTLDSPCYSENALGRSASHSSRQIALCHFIKAGVSADTERSWQEPEATTLMENILSHQGTCKRSYHSKDAQIAESLNPSKVG